MDIAVLADIHGNHIALRRCLQEAFERGIERFFFLGDYLGEQAFPQKTMEILHEMNEKYRCEFIRGNKEEYWLSYRDGGGVGWKEKDSITGCLFYTYHQLTDRDFAFYETMPMAKRMEFEGLPALTICHGSPEQTKQQMLPGRPETLETMEACSTDLILCGHTHISCVIEHRGKRTVNTGSVGTPLDGDKKTHFLILHGADGRWEEEFVALDYDAEEAVRQLYESGLYENAPSWCRVTEHILRTGKGSHGGVLQRAMELCRRETGTCVWPDIPERFMQRAVKEMLDAEREENGQAAQHAKK